MILVESTHPGTVKPAHQARWIRLRKSRGCDEDRTWIFTDGSSLGGFAAVILRGEEMLTVSDWRKPTPTKNIAAELNALVLGLREAQRGEKITVVSDYLGVAAWMTSNWKMKDQEVRTIVESAKDIVKSLELDVRYIHHGSHQTDDSDFTKMNNLVDKLAGEMNKRGK